MEDNNNNSDELIPILGTFSLNQGTEPNPEASESSSPLIVPFSPPPPLFPLTDEVEMPPNSYNSWTTPMPDLIGAGLGIGNLQVMSLLPPQTTYQYLQKQQQQVPLPSLTVVQPTMVSRVPFKPKSRDDQQIVIKKVVTGVSVEEAMIFDSWGWRKYGQKPVKGSSHPRGYYRCSTVPGCPAKKHIEKNIEDPNYVIITYAGDHNHQLPLRRNSLSGTTRSKKKLGSWSLSELSPTTLLAEHTSSQMSAEEHQVAVKEDIQSTKGGEEEQQLAVEDIEILREGELVFLGGGDGDGSGSAVLDAGDASSSMSCTWDGFDYGGDDDGDDHNGADIFVGVDSDVS